MTISAKLQSAVAPAARRALPYAESRIVERLWEERRYRKLGNYLWVQWLMGRGTTRAWGARPYWLTLDPSNFCQLQCPFCPTGANKGTRNKSQMNFDHYKRFIDHVGPYVIRMEFMNWGESLFNKRLPDMIAEAKRHGIRTELHENFNNVPDEMIKRLVDSGLDILSVSVDGLTQETYEKYRIGGKLDRVLANLQSLVEARDRQGSQTPKIAWQFLVFRHNQHEVDRVEAFARERGADEVRIKAAFLPTEGEYMSAWMPTKPEFQLYPPPDDLDAWDPNAPLPKPNKEVRTSTSMRVRRFKRRQILSKGYLRDLVQMIDTPSDVPRAARSLVRAAKSVVWPDHAAGSSLLRAKPGDTPGFCEWPWAGMTINPEGSTSPCCAMEDQADDFGNVFDESWGDLWNGRNYRTARRHVARYRAGKTGILADSDNPCERCTMIGNIKFGL